MHSQEEDRFTSPCSSSRDPWRLGPSSLGFHQQASTRRRFLEAYKHDLEKEESNANMILRSFDLTGSPIHRSERRDAQMNDGVSNKSFSSHATQASNPTGNPYLSTPLRQKYFSRLSPTILREILRSPSFRVPTPEPSFIEGSSNSPLELTHSSLGLKPVYPKLSLDDSSISLPPTPPPTAKIPSLMSFLPDTRLPSVGAPLTGSYIDKLDHSANKLPSPKPSPKSRTSLPSLVCPIAQRNFQLVIDELTGTKRTVERRCDSTMSLPPLPVSVLLPKQINNANAMSSANLNSKPPSHSCVSKQRPLSLTSEFATLLIRRARLEEEEAQQLKALAHRLENLARDRRKLSEVVASTHSKEHASM